MEQSPKVSVIIPVYNAEKYLRECLDSVVNQTLKEIEIICVDDGSTDGSLTILREYRKKDKRVKVLTQANEGVSAARNRGLLSACGEFVAFLDSDDYIEISAYEISYKEAKKKMQIFWFLEARVFRRSSGRIATYQHEIRCI